MHKLVKMFLGCLLIVNTAAIYAEEAKKMTLSSSGFLGDGALPVLYTCDGKSISPEIAWADQPAKTKSFALIMSDPDAPKGTFYHWIVFNIPASAKDVPEGNNPPVKGALIGKNDFGKEEYGGPCPPKGGVHSYVFTVYALDNTLSLQKGASAKEVIAAMQKHILAEDQIVATYSRWFK